MKTAPWSIDKIDCLIKRHIFRQTFLTSEMSKTNTSNADSRLRYVNAAVFIQRFLRAQSSKMRTRFDGAEEAVEKKKKSKITRGTKFESYLASRPCSNSIPSSLYDFTVSP